MATTPRGLRNNNPLNIRYSSANNWLGKVTPNTDGTFEQFTAMKYGYRAAFVLIRNYIKKGLTTVKQIVSKWAPSNENNTSGYISTVCELSELSANTVISPTDEDQMVGLVAAMSMVENGVSIKPDYDAIYEGYDLAGTVAETVKEVVTEAATEKKTYILIGLAALLVGAIAMKVSNEYDDDYDYEDDDD